VLKLAGSKPAPAPAPVEPIAEPAEDAGFGDSGGEGFEEPAPADDMSGDMGAEAPAEDKPFDDEPFDAGVEADEESDPKKYIEQLSGKLGQSLRDFTETQGQPDLELEKFAINSVISATHTADMDEEDKNDIIKKIETSGGNDTESSDDGGDNNGEDSFDMPDDSGDEMGSPDDFGGDMAGGEDEEIDEVTIFEEKGTITDPHPDGWKEMDGIMLDIAKRNNMFQPGSNDKLKNTLGENLTNSKKMSIFDKNYVLNKLHESLNQDDMNSEPLVKPAPTKTPTEVPVGPSRRNKPFLPMPDVEVPPKAVKEIRGKAKPGLETYYKTFSEAVQTARQMAEEKGYEISDDDWWREVAMGPRKPQSGQTNRYTLPLYVNGKEQRKALQIQVYGMENNYELNAYIA
jgi:hypothetical protein